MSFASSIYPYYFFLLTAALFCASIDILFYVEKGLIAKSEPIDVTPTPTATPTPTTSEPATPVVTVTDTLTFGSDSSDQDGNPITNTATAITENELLDLTTAYLQAPAAQDISAGAPVRMGINGGVFTLQSNTSTTRTLSNTTVDQQRNAPSFFYIDTRYFISLLDYDDTYLSGTGLYLTSVTNIGDTANRFIVILSDTFYPTTGASNTTPEMKKISDTNNDTFAIYSSWKKLYGTYHLILMIYNLNQTLYLMSAVVEDNEYLDDNDIPSIYRFSTPTAFTFSGSETICNAVLLPTSSASTIICVCTTQSRTYVYPITVSFTQPGSTHDSSVVAPTPTIGSSTTLASYTSVGTAIYMDATALQASDASFSNTFDVMVSMTLTSDSTLTRVDVTSFQWNGSAIVALSTTTLSSGVALSSYIESSYSTSHTALAQSNPVSSNSVNMIYVLWPYCWALTLNTSTGVRTNLTNFAKLDPYFQIQRVFNVRMYPVSIWDNTVNTVILSFCTTDLTSLGITPPLSSATATALTSNGTAIAATFLRGDKSSYVVNCLAPFSASSGYLDLDLGNQLKYICYPVLTKQRIYPPSSTSNSWKFNDQFNGFNGALTGMHTHNVLLNTPTSVSNIVGIFGVAVETKTSGSTIKVATVGQIATSSDLTGLSPGRLYYLQTTGLLSTTTRANYEIGTALSSNQFLVTKLTSAV